MEIAGNAIALLNPTAIAFPKQAIICTFKTKGDRILKQTAQNKMRSHSTTNHSKPKCDRPPFSVLYAMI
ncbi:MAG: YehR family protein [Tolypothrix brevis GSE-NOS-MK-07-07A]|nr:YehR family protein [Tolypothrix brevis GSE-NOS-MK-07-07A]